MADNLTTPYTLDELKRIVASNECLVFENEMHKRLASQLLAAMHREKELMVLLQSVLLGNGAVRGDLYDEIEQVVEDASEYKTG